VSFLRRSNGKYASSTTRKPVARSEDLVIEELDDELLIYDRNNKRAHCLSATAASVWRACDGKSDAETIATILELSPDAVAAALEELEGTELLESSKLEVLDGSGDGEGNGQGWTRRQLAKRSVRVGGAVAAAPLILSITAPAAWATPTPPQFFCEIYTTGSCGAGNAGCGTIAGCCCCDSGCPGAGVCKGCSSIKACALGQPCSNSNNTANLGCSDAHGPQPFTVCGCCGPPFFPNLKQAGSSCGCGWGGNTATPNTNGNIAPVDLNGISTSGWAADKNGVPIVGNPGGGCCDTSSTGPDAGSGFVKCFQGSTCVPCCGGRQIFPGSHFGCCGGYFAANAQTDACNHTKPFGYPATC
jgi:hypothetical protein